MCSSTPFPRGNPSRLRLKFPQPLSCVIWTFPEMNKLRSLNQYWVPSDRKHHHPSHLGLTETWLIGKGNGMGLAPTNIRPLHSTCNYRVRREALLDWSLCDLILGIRGAKCYFICTAPSWDSKDCLIWLGPTPPPGDPPPSRICQNNQPNKL